MGAECSFPAAGPNCTSTWEEEIGSTRHIVSNIGFAVNLFVLIPNSIYGYQTYLCYSSLKVAKNPFTFHIMAFTNIGLAHLTGIVYFLTGMCCKYLLDEPLGFISALSYILIILFTLTGSCCLLIVLQNVIFATIQLNGKRIKRKSSNWMDLWGYTAPLVLGSVVIFILLAGGFVKHPAILTRIALGYTSIPSIYIAVRGVIVGRRMLKIVSHQLNKVTNESQKARVATTQSKIQLGLKILQFNCFMAFLICLSFGISDVLYDPFVFVIANGYCWGAALVPFHLVLMQILKPAVNKIANEPIERSEVASTSHSSTLP